MADQSDVENALVSLVAGGLYPNGMSAPSAPGCDCRIYRGWPNAASLDQDLAAGVANVSVFAGDGGGRLTTRYTQEWFGGPVPPTLAASVFETSVTFGGEAGAGQVAGILVDGNSYAYRLVAGDTLASVAANLASLIRADRIVQLSGSTITIPGARNLLVRVVADAPVQKEVRRQMQNFRVTCWCPTPASRDATAAAIDSALAALTFIALPDGSLGRLLYTGTISFDQSEDAMLYRRDLLYSVEYPTIIATTQPSMLFGDIQLNAIDLTT